MFGQMKVRSFVASISQMSSLARKARHIGNDWVANLP